jgi:hypothetical protein
MSYIRVSIQGDITGGEVWSVNPVFDPTGELPGVPDQATLDAVCLAIANLTPGTNMLNMLSSGFRITGARLEQRSDTTDALEGLSVQTRTTPLVGGGSVVHPAQIAMVISLRTNTPGARGRGRIYWPCPAVGIMPNFHISSTVTGLVLTDAKAYFSNMSAALDPLEPSFGFDLSVRSKANHATPHVTRLQIGDVPDTQRRRRDAFPESYATVSYP